MKVYKFYQQMFKHLPGLEFCEDPVHTIKCELLYFDAVLLYMMNAPFIWTIINGCFKILMLNALFYGGGIAPFIWTIINGCFKISMLRSMVEELHHLFGLS